MTLSLQTERDGFSVEEEKKVIVLFLRIKSALFGKLALKSYEKVFGGG